MCAVGDAVVAVVCRQRQLAVGRDVEVVGPQAHRDVALRVGHFLAIDLEHRDLVSGELAGDRALAVGGERHVSHMLADDHRVDQLHLLALYREHADGVVSAICDQRQAASTVDRHARGLLAYRNRIDEPRRVGREVDDVELVVRRGLPAGAFLHPVHRVGHQRKLSVRRYAQIGRRAEYRIHQRQAGDDLRIGGFGADVDNRHQVLAGRRELNFAVVAPHDFIVDADHHVLGLARQHAIRG